MSTATLSAEPWGLLPGGEPVHLFTLRNAHDMKVTISDLGATLVSWHAPDRAGRLQDVLLGHDTPAQYHAGTAYMGAIVGRWANRIAGARFTLDGIEYVLDRNEGDNLLHGGATGFHRARWEAGQEDGALVFKLESEEGDAGFPGNVSVQVRYTLDDDGALTIDYTAHTDAPTPLNLTNHAYFNLAADASSDIRGHVMTIDADRFFEVDAALIPCRASPVAGNAFDFRQSAPIGARLDWPHAQLTIARGFDHCYLLHGAGADPEASHADHAGQLRRAARAYDPTSGRELTVSTDQRGLQFYTGNYLEGVRGRNGAVYARHAGFCVEAGAFPNEINMDAREHLIVRPGMPYRQVTRYRLGIGG
ncbi:aldose epimerase family protein [Trinickia caryophylli]|nr:aldose epimerase family protein [Trinickia caryophylli]PMS09836.1 galactose mutarotase [Trinickia caryophylli]TRX16872.1 galactose mutarotase [Trinickia caryophylli]WQE12398.1 aldose epimerase family protein [Trinickia caryophylli]